MDAGEGNGKEGGGGEEEEGTYNGRWGKERLETGKIGEREREADRLTDRQRQTETDRQTHRQRHFVVVLFACFLTPNQSWRLFQRQTGDDDTILGKNTYFFINKNLFRFRITTHKVYENISKS